MSTQPEVGVITPVYNGAKYLAESIESVLAQTYSNWTLTIVNNCSTDSTAEVARSYAARDSRIRFHENPQFLPAIANHNASLRLLPPDSKYCKLLFADDWLFPECLERTVALAEAHPSVGIVGAYGLQDAYVLWTGLAYSHSVVAGREACRQRLLNGPYVFGSGTSQLFRAEIVRNLDPFYNENNLHCDSEVCFKILQDSDFGFIHQILSYNRAPGNQSLTTKARRLSTLEIMTFFEFLTYGPVFLTPEEFQSCKPKQLAQYYSVMAHSILEGNESWDFQKAKLAEFGLTLDHARFAKAVLTAGFDALFHSPVETLAKLGRRRNVIYNRLRALFGRSN